MTAVLHNKELVRYLPWGRYLNFFAAYNRRKPPVARGPSHTISDEKGADKCPITHEKLISIRQIPCLLLRCKTYDILVSKIISILDC